ncbi:PREDICTED: cytochrome B5-like protein [Fragaria vesca subsp. vesca]|uniref:cytochrome B5-like protein n=1 Tax=Fragaria vesca subsp. vesca TaxID=101020 RepID=UPI0002C2E129|nr:PREDICTED: cytochrome B5-like protein [Fragaria vesca subsp. vesca]XP_011459292.1 PREDICTED: cytochrome B5-like protein [Fragaria vesca subsp. vesca]
MILAVVALLLCVFLGAFALIPSGNTKNVKSNAKAEKTAKIYTKAEVALHNKRTDCWVIIKNKVYDLTPYVEVHPGGDAILAHAGDDSTIGFYGPQHASLVYDMVHEFYIGDLEPGAAVTK